MSLSLLMYMAMNSLFIQPQSSVRAENRLEQSLTVTTKALESIGQGNAVDIRAGMLCSALLVFFQYYYHADGIAYI